MKSFVVHQEISRLVEYPGAHSYQLFEQNNSPIQGAAAMLNIFYSSEYPPAPGVHDDNEGFFIVSGYGSVKIDVRENEMEFDLVPGTAILVPAGIPHAVRKKGNEDLKAFIYHFPVQKEL